MIDKLKIFASGLVLIAGVVSYYYLPEVSILIRVGIIIVAIVIASVLAVMTEYGQSFLGFAKGANTELRKMVWPTRPETIQTTIMVIVVVFLMALFLWAVDVVVFKSVYGWILGIG